MKEYLKKMLRSDFVQILYGIIFALLLVLYISCVIYVGGFNTFAYKFNLTRGLQVTLFLATMLLIISFILNYLFIKKGEDEEGYQIGAFIAAAISCIMGIVIITSSSCNC